MFSVTIRVTDAGGGTNDKTFSLPVNGGGLFKTGGVGGGSCGAEPSAQPVLLALAALAVLAVGLRLRRRAA